MIYYGTAAGDKWSVVLGENSVYHVIVVLVHPTPLVKHINALNYLQLSINPFKDLFDGSHTSVSYEFQCTAYNHDFNYF